MTVDTTALAFDGRNDELTTSGAAALGLNDSFTIEAWVSMSSVTKYDQAVLQTADGELAALVRERKPTLVLGGTVVQSEVKLSPNRWYHVAWRFDHRTGEAAVFVDGLADIRGVATGYAGNAAGVIAKSNRPSTGFLGAVISVRVYEMPRSDEDIRAASYHDDEPSPNGIRAHYALGTTTSGTVEDLSGAGNHATLVGSPKALSVSLADPDPTPAYGPDVPSAYYFPDDRTHVRLPSAAQVGMTGASFTVEAWLRLAEATIDDEPVLGTNDFDTGEALTLSLRSRRPFMSFGGPNARGRAKLPVDTWVHVAWRYNADDQLATLFVDGAEVASSTLPPFVGKGTLNIARAQNQQILHGEIAEVRLWSIARDDEDIAHGVQNPPAANAAGLTAYWKPGEIAGRTVPDRGTRGFHGLLEGGTGAARPAPEVPVGPAPGVPPVSAMYVCTHFHLFRYDLQTRKIDKVGSFHTDGRATIKVYDLGFTTDGTCFAMGRGRLYTVDLATAQLTAVSDTNRLIYALHGLPDGRLIGAGYGAVCEIDPTTGAETELFEIPADNLGGLTQIADGRLIATYVLERSYPFASLPGRSQFREISLENKNTVELAEVPNAIGGLAYANGVLYGMLDTDSVIVDTTSWALGTTAPHSNPGRFTGAAGKPA